MITIVITIIWTHFVTIIWKCFFNYHYYHVGDDADGGGDDVVIMVLDGLVTTICHIFDGF